MGRTEASDRASTGDGDADEPTTDATDGTQEAADATDAPEAGDPGPTGRREPPTVDGLPVLANTVEFMRDPLGFYERAGEYGDVVETGAFGSTVYHVRHPEAMRRILVEDQQRFRKPAILRDVTDQVAPDSMVAIEGEQWRRIRELAQPAFTARQVQSYADAVVDEAAALADGWTDGDRVDVPAAMKDLTLEVLGRAMFGRDFADVAPEVATATEAINDRFDVRSVSRLLPPWVPTPTNRRFNRAMDAFDDVIDDLVAERRAREEPGEDLLGFLVAAGEGDGLSDAELRDQLFTVLFAGHETSSLALTYAWLLLARNPEARTRLHEEVDALDADPDAATLPELEYTERVVKEALRLYPPAHLILRQTTEAVTLQGYHVPADSQLSMPTYFVHRDERWWDAPEAFRPERWREDPEPEYSYFPFGGGPRACIGSRFATMELKLALATVARRVTLDLPRDGVRDPDLRMSVTLQPDDPIDLAVSTR
jgi:cytochrome P450